ncbi:MAG: GNAT family N-acetyltransferase [Acidimicrobiales bacterium]
MSARYSRPTLLERDHVLDDFTCRSDEQAEWLLGHARQASAVGSTRVLVVTPPGNAVVVAYYAWCMASVSAADAPTRMGKGAGRYPRPVALLARMGVHGAHEGRGLGAGLLQDVIARTHALGQIGCRGLLVHAETSQARDFYLNLVPELEESPTDDLHLFLLMKDIRKTLG